MSAIDATTANANSLGWNSLQMDRASTHGLRELSLGELELVGGGIDWGQVSQAATIGAVAGAIGGAVTGGMAGAFIGGLGAGPGAVLGAGMAGVGGAVTGAVTSIMVQYMAN